MVRLSAEQESALARVVAANRVHRLARVEAEEEAQRLVKQRVDAAATERSRAVRDALAAGVPRSRVGQVGLGTRDWATIDRVLSLTDPDAAATSVSRRVAAEGARRVRTTSPGERERFAAKVSAPGDLLLRVDWPGYRVDDGHDLQVIFARDTFDFAGYVHRFPGVPGEWQLLEDDHADGSVDAGPLETLLGIHEGPLQAALDDVAASA